MQEYLLGYLLGALEEDEQQMVQRQLQTDPQLRAELERLRERLQPLEDLRGDYEPPEGLAAMTCERIAELQRSATAPRPRPVVRETGGNPRHWSLLDIIVAASIVAAASLLFFPAIANSRHAARLAQCQNNLRELGVALTKFSEQDPQRRFPPVASSGNMAFAGSYAPQLVEQQLVSDPRTFLCPSSELATNPMAFRVPTRAEIEAASGAQLEQLQRMAGGDYGYHIGHLDDGRHISPRNWGRSFFPIMADAPSALGPQRHSLNHGGNEHNVLYEGGNIRHIVGSLAEQLPDDPLRNRQGNVAAGLDVDDAVIGASHTPPLPR